VSTNTTQLSQFCLVHCSRRIHDAFVFMIVDGPHLYRRVYAGLSRICSSIPIPGRFRAFYYLAPDRKLRLIAVGWDMMRAKENGVSVGIEHGPSMGAKYYIAGVLLYILKSSKARL
jgi:hypothetical protein